ncbi:MAG: DNA methyltransferase [Candidatus Parcubacteria bacterium]|nr:MAG: DNA methyltransferase [Candidatus Parcubacteria bacterium]
MIKKNVIGSIAPFAWYGGKQRIAHKIIKILPKHKVYVEVFGGSGAVLFAKNPNVSELEVYNDIDKNVYTFFKVLRDKNKANELVRMLELTPYSRDMHKEAKEMLEKTNDDLMRAYYFFVNVEMGFSGSLNAGFSYSIKDKIDVKRFRNKVDKLELFSDRLKYVQIENIDFAELINKYDTQDTLFYLDPPYVADTRRTFNDYKHELNNDRHKELVDMLLNIKGNAVLSGYNNDIYKPLTDAGWNRYEIKTHCMSSNSKNTNNKRESRIEVLWIKNETPQNLFSI